MRSSSCYNGSVISDTLYVRLYDRNVYAYAESTSTWSRLPDSRFLDCPSVIINNFLTLIGGRYRNIITNQLFSLTEKGRSRRWTEEFPPMPTKRWGTIALCTGTALIVAGGVSDRKVPKVVEVMNTETYQWFTAADLPEPLWELPAAVCGDQIYILTKNNMYTCSESALIQSCRSKVMASLWNRFAAPPVTGTTCVSIHGQLLTVGGKDSKLTPTTAVHRYNLTTNSWEVVSYMTIPRSKCFAAVLPNNQLVVVGGYTDSVELATIEYSTHCTCT